MAQLVGKNEAVDYINGMNRQRPSEGMEYPTNTNMRGGARPGGHRGENDREHHAGGESVGQDDVMEREPHNMGMGVGNMSRRMMPRDNAMPQNNVMMKKGGMMHEKRDCR